MNNRLSFSDLFKLACDLGAKDPNKLASDVMQMSANPCSEDIYKLCLQEMSARIRELEAKCTTPASNS